MTAVMTDDDTPAEAPEPTDEFVDPFEDDTPIACGIENPETCESCT